MAQARANVGGRDPGHSQGAASPIRVATLDFQRRCDAVPSGGRGGLTLLGIAQCAANLGRFRDGAAGCLSSGAELTGVSSDGGIGLCLPEHSNLGLAAGTNPLGAFLRTGSAGGNCAYFSG